MYSRFSQKLISFLLLFFGVVFSAQADVSISGTTDAAEPATNGLFTISRTGSTAQPLTVFFEAPTGTATVNLDYTLPAQQGQGAASVIIPAGATSTPYSLFTLDDTLGEGTESIVLTIQPDNTYVINPNFGTAQIRLVDNELAVPTVSIAQISDATEGGNDGVFTISRTGPMTAVTIQLATPTGTAISGTDYNTQPTSITIAAGQTASVINITAVDDTLVEGTETVIFTITADAAYNITTASATLNIIDNDAAPTPDVSIIQNSDANESGTAGQFAISRTGSTANPLTVQLAGPTGTATSGADYTALPTSVTLPAGTGNFVLNVPPVDDALVEGTETVILTIAADAAYNITTGSATLNIIDNDGAIVDISIAQTSHANESGTDGVFTLSRTGSTANALTIQLATPTGTATSGTDYNTQPTSLTIAAGQATGVLNITPIDDALVEGTETVILAIAAAAAYNITTGSATVNIVDNDLNSGSNTPIPTLTTWALILMILSLIFIAIPIMTRQR